MTRNTGWMLAGLMVASLALGACKPKVRAETAQNPGQGETGSAQEHKDYLKSQSADVRRALDSMPAPTGGDSNNNN